MDYEQIKGNGQDPVGLSFGVECLCGKPDD